MERKRNQEQTKGLQTKGLRRNTIDKYYTKPDVVDVCINLVKQHLQINAEDFIIEPCAGNGAFIRGIQSLSNHSIFYDIEPENDEIIEQDYLLFELQNNHDKKIHVIGNPPFGRQSSMAIQFIKKSCQFCDTLSFILPKSFKKDSLKKTFPSQFHLLHETDLPEKSFLVNGLEHHVPCIFQIWEKKEYNRVAIKNAEPSHFIFVRKENNPDISFRRVGVNAGMIDVNTTKKSVQSHYFIRFTNSQSVEENLKELSAVTFGFNNTVGPKSVSKQELILAFNPLLKK
jgi:predicted RNA methylase